MSGRYFKCTCSEFFIYIIIKYYWYTPVKQWYKAILAGKVGIAFIIRVHTYCGIAKYCFRAHGSNGYIFFLVSIQFITYVIQFRIRSLKDHLLITQRCFCLRVPVYHLYSTIYKPLTVQLYKYPYYCCIIFIIHRKVCAAPIECATQLFQLFQYYTAIFLLPLPCILQEFLTRQGLFIYTPLAQHTHYLSFSSYRCMVRAGHPAGVIAHHFGTAYQYILHTVIESMPHMQHTGHIRWRHYNSIRWPVIRLTRKISRFFPMRIPL